MSKFFKGFEVVDFLLMTSSDVSVPIAKISLLQKVIIFPWKYLNHFKYCCYSIFYDTSNATFSRM